MSKKITFLLPGSSGKPSGGARIVYEYANRLANRDNSVSIVHAPITRIDSSLKMLIKAIVRYPQRILDKSFRPDRWLQVDKKVRVFWVPCFYEHFIPDGDIVVATAWMTSEWISRYSPRKGEKFYFIQHFEDWDTSKERVEKTWKLPLHKIVIAKWLRNIAKQLGQSVFYIPNALDFHHFFTEVPIHRRKPNRGAMLYHTHEFKGSNYGLEALEKVHRINQKLEMDFFGLPAPPKNLPPWITYHQNPSQVKLRNIYNRAAFFVAPSLSEGWPLPPAEALACGAALVATDIGGHKEYSIHGNTALLSPPKDTDALASNIVKLIDNNELRFRLVINGQKLLNQFTWEKSVTAFEQALYYSCY
ncbi:glycosyltransferase family 4 protein [Desulfatiglans anilini]|uniref:glycosyltransferase family 4 protein n=1 Tax=Desulfatiglans anilini TaxID=90728 RepID=UPI000403A419|nr:glycosyltransferase family 4 protein [Desulfatiglans anilini]